MITISFLLLISVAPAIASSEDENHPQKKVTPISDSSEADDNKILIITTSATATAIFASLGGYLGLLSALNILRNLPTSGPYLPDISMLGLACLSFPLLSTIFPAIHVLLINIIVHRVVLKNDIKTAIGVGAITSIAAVAGGFLFGAIATGGLLDLIVLGIFPGTPEQMAYSFIGILIAIPIVSAVASTTVNIIATAATTE